MRSVGELDPPFVKNESAEETLFAEGVAVTDACIAVA
jgi:hypothetical protein